MTEEEWALAGLADGWVLAWLASGSWELATFATAAPVMIFFILYGLGSDE